MLAKLLIGLCVFAFISNAAICAPVGNQTEEEILPKEQILLEVNRKVSKTLDFLNSLLSTLKGRYAEIKATLHEDLENKKAEMKDTLEEKFETLFDSFSRKAEQFQDTLEDYKPGQFKIPIRNNQDDDDE